ncbi:50S ribosomal protein L17 [Candidatus Falkowbacteria bacterium CG10_big_fil_rev_8_21_14_0_10_37_6]|uniref:Large ribosomal subunit protein bL17 n=1 Tax=Candidatus Falkowbacteria bacterium CG10_big_fil_rev_8_21_14_0_10_37_6 TaxID=1974563 RepID=A0A2H0V6S3_9BACT|nr:MAG: 50S ribosomal protein L17 [Candidatus Falkowbacteria bacterium CG10_big_fil_rev_8_21_14_0_10_37_6]
MRHRNKTKTLDRKKQPREMMLRNLASSVIMYEKVKTTEAKAKVVRSLVDKTITISKKGDLTSRRKLIALLPQKKAIAKLMDVLSKKYQDRKGGYTRIIKLGSRQGDGADIVQIELV